jgi:hypothetical protein
VARQASAPSGSLKRYAQAAQDAQPTHTANCAQKKHVIQSEFLNLKFSMEILVPTTARPMLHHKDQITVKASPQKVWNTIKKFDSIHTWHPAAESTVLLVGGNGKPLAVREFQTTDGGSVISELLEYDETKMRFKYRILKASIPLHGYM